MPVLYSHPASICSQMARLALAEKGVAYTCRTVDIMDTAEQFEPWYVALNPKAVVPTLVRGDEVITDTKRIVTHVDAGFDGPALTAADENRMRGWLDDIMGLHYGVLLYAPRMGADGSLPPQIEERGALLTRLIQDRPDLAPMLRTRADGNARFQALLRDPAGIEAHISATRDLVDRMIKAVGKTRFLCGDAYSLADCFATAALARFRIHGFEHWWAETPLAAYYAAMRQRPSFAAAGVIETGTERDL